MRFQQAALSAVAATAAGLQANSSVIAPRVMVVSMV